MSIKDKLSFYKSHIHTKTDNFHDTTLTTPQTLPTTASSSDAWHAAWDELHASPFQLDNESIMVRQIRYPLSYRHGRYTLGEILAVLAKWNESNLNHPLLGHGRKENDLLFFDTETTGLQGGTGNTIFLLGTSFIEDDAVIVHQHLLTDPFSEAALYHSFLGDMRDRTHLVTYNGKSFDWPQVKTRHTMLRDTVPLLPTLEHVDLLHAARRLWRDDLESCRLSLIEPEKLSVIRKNDVPGSMAPLLYFDFLHTKDPKTITGVLLHNQIDVLSLITLYTHISNLILDTKTYASMEERLRLAHWFDALGQTEYAISLYEQLIQTSGALRTSAQVAAGFCYKKLKLWHEAITVWECALHDEELMHADVYTELSKVYEHQHKDYEKALYYAFLAFDTFRRRSRLLRKETKKGNQAYQKRIDRLTQKVIDIR